MLHEHTSQYGSPRLQGSQLSYFRGKNPLRRRDDISYISWQIACFPLFQCCFCFLFCFSQTRGQVGYFQLLKTSRVATSQGRQGYVVRDKSGICHGFWKFSWEVRDIICQLIYFFARKKHFQSFEDCKFQNFLQPWWTI